MKLKYLIKCFLAKRSRTKEADLLRFRFDALLPSRPEYQIQDHPWMLKDDNHCYVAMERIEGIRGTWALFRKKRLFGKDKVEYYVCGDGTPQQRDDSVLWKVSDKYNIENNLLYIMGRHNFVIMRGKCVGPDIMDNPYKRTELEIYVDKIIFPEERVSPVRAQKISEFYGLRFAPILDVCLGLPETVDEMFDYARGDSKIGPVQRKGVLIRDTESMKSFEVSV